MPRLRRVRGCEGHSRSARTTRRAATGGDRTTDYRNHWRRGRAGTKETESLRTIVELKASGALFRDTSLGWTGRWRFGVDFSCRFSQWSLAVHGLANGTIHICLGRCSGKFTFNFLVEGDRGWEHGRPAAYLLAAIIVTVKTVIVESPGLSLASLTMQAGDACGQVTQTLAAPREALVMTNILRTHDTFMMAIWIASRA